MNSKRFVIFFLISVGLSVLPDINDGVRANDGIKSLRGDRIIDAPSVTPVMNRWAHDSTPIRRHYVQQPPLIPHSIEKYKINLKFNKCLTCHSWSNYIDSGATKVSLTHFVDFTGEELSNLAGRRYFCTQCHVPQMQAEPLVESDFRPIDLLNDNK